MKKNSLPLNSDVLVKFKHTYKTPDDIRFVSLANLVGEPSCELHIQRLLAGERMFRSKHPRSFKSSLGSDTQYAAVKSWVLDQIWRRSK